MGGRFFNLNDEQWGEFSQLYEPTTPPRAFDAEDVCLIWKPRVLWYKITPGVTARPCEVMWCVMTQEPMPANHKLIQLCRRVDCIAFDHQQLEKTDDKTVNKGPSPKSIDTRFIAHMGPKPNDPSAHWFPLPLKPMRRRTRYYRGAGRDLVLPKKVYASQSTRKADYFRLRDANGTVKTSLELAYEHNNNGATVPYGQTVRTSCQVPFCHAHLVTVSKLERMSRVDRMFLTTQDGIEVPQAPIESVEADDRGAMVLSLSEPHKFDLLLQLGDRMYDEVSRDELVAIIRRVTSDDPTTDVTVGLPSIIVTDGLQPRSSNILLFLNKEVVSRFLSFVTVGSKDECWTYDGATNQAGLGVFKLYDGRNVTANRVAYVIYKKADFYGNLQHIDNQTDESCCNPFHWKTRYGV